MNYKQCAKLLLTHENILIVTHRNPDGDTVASAAALCSALRTRAERKNCSFLLTDCSREQKSVPLRQKQRRRYAAETLSRPRCRTESTEYTPQAGNS